jgi:hypothetical protein
MMSITFLISIIVVIAIGIAVTILRRKASDSVALEGTPSPELAADARRLAKMLATEIAMDHQQQVQEGRIHRDLYFRLRDPIDSAREFYDQRIAVPVKAEQDHLYNALVDVLADGDADALAGYPRSGGRTASGRTSVH